MAIRVKPPRVEEIYWRRIQTPIGPLTLFASRQGLLLIAFARQRGEWVRRWLVRHAPHARLIRKQHPILDKTERQLKAYFAATRKNFELPLDLRANGIRRRVLQRVGSIPLGDVSTYGAVARGLGMPRAARAIGAANGSNPLPIVIGCHRVVASDGKLTGFGGGLSIKRWLLRHEGLAVERGRVAQIDEISSQR